MPEFTFVDYVYFKENEKKPKIHHKNFILDQEPYFTITSELSLLENKLKSLTTLFVKSLVPWIIDDVQVVAQLSRIDVRSKQKQEK